MTDSWPDFFLVIRQLLAHVELFIHQHPEVLPYRTALDAFAAQPVFVFQTVPT